MEKKTILIVDDEPDVLTYLSSLLEDNGYVTIKAKDGVEALKAAESSNINLITLDITMPEMSGVKFYKIIKEHDVFKKIPIIIITGISDDFQRFISTRRQVPPPEGYLSKPINPNDLLALVKKLVG